MSESEIRRAPLAYENEPFLNSPDGRIIRLLSEYSEPLARFRREQIQDTVVFFGSARFHNRSSAEKTLASLSGNDGDIFRKRAAAAVDMARYYEDARKLACMLSKWSLQIPARWFSDAATT